jgi:hypothetical protein
MGSSGALRQRRHRERQRDGLVILHVSVDEVALAEQMAIAGFLAPTDAYDRKKLTQALERIIQLWSGAGDASRQY